LSAALRLLQQGSVRELVYSDGGSLVMQLKPHRSEAAAYVAGVRYAARLVPGSESSIFRAAQEAVTRGEALTLRYAAAPFGPAQVFSLMLPLALLFCWYKAMKGLMKKDETYTNPRGRRRPTEKTTFRDVVSRSKVELAEIVDYLNRPEKYKDAGARMPRGALLVGPSGTGKTLLARAVAGEAHCAFISASASEFVEVYVGRGAARVRDLFRQARESAPAVLFLDEIDALGTRSRGSDGRGANDEYVQTLNQLLTELDGFHGQGDGVVVLAATNRHEALDPALLRPGRFDRHVFVELPGAEERAEILAIHVTRAAAAEGADPRAIAHVAANSQGFSGAELANVVNEAIFLALRAGRTKASAEDFCLALGRARSTKQRAAAAGGAGIFFSRKSDGPVSCAD